MGERIGYIGLGKMGLALSKVLLEDGHEVCGYDVDEERKKMLADAGGRPARLRPRGGGECGYRLLDSLEARAHRGERFWGKRGRLRQ